MNNNEIADIRRQIDRIQKDLFQLLVQRHELSEKMWQIKKNAHVQFDDQIRENQLIHQFDHEPQMIHDLYLKKYIHNCFEQIILLNKKVLRERLEKND